MAKQGETIFKERVLRLLKKLSPIVKATKIQQRAKRGTLDIIMCADGRYVEWELKVEDGRPDPLQMYEMELTAKARGLAWVVKPSNLEWSFKELQRLVGLEPLSLNELEHLHGSIQKVHPSPDRPFQLEGRAETYRPAGGGAKAGRKRTSRR